MTPTSTPAQPNQASYSLTALNLFTQYLTTEAAATAGITVPVFNPAIPQKRWSRPVQPGEDPADGYVAGTWIPAADNASISYHATGIAMSIGEAAAVNIAPDTPPPANDPLFSQPGYASPEVPIPARNLLPNENAPQFVIGGWIVTRTDLAAAASPDAPTLAQIYADTQAIRAALKV